MSKKWIAVIVTVALAGLLAVPALAATDSSAKSWFDSRFAAKKAYVDQAVQDGKITAEQGTAWKAHFDEMYKFHEQNGFTCPMGNPGQGAGLGMGPGNGKGFGQGKGMGRGAGMGGGWANQAPQAPAQQ